MIFRTALEASRVPRKGMWGINAVAEKASPEIPPAALYLLQLLLREYV